MAQLLVLVSLFLPRPAQALGSSIVGVSGPANVALGTQPFIRSGGGVVQSTTTDSMTLGSSLTVTNVGLFKSSLTVAGAAFSVGGSTFSVSQGGVTMASATVTGSAVVQTSMTVNGQVNMGYEKITNNCGAGVTTCTASCSANKVATGGGCSAAVALTTDEPVGSNQWECDSLTATTIIAYAFCSRMGN